MTNEVIKRPSSEPVAIANNANQALYKNLREWREYASALEEDVKNLSERVIELNEQSQPEIESLKTQLISREKQVIELKEADKAQGKEIVQLKSQLQQQSLPVVPECVAKDVKRLSLSTLADWNVAVSYISKETLEWLSTTGNTNIFLGKSWTLCSLKINGFKVEKPQLFYLKNKLTGDRLAICLARASSGLYVEVTEKWLTRKEQTSYKLYFTQQEIDSMETGSYELVPVEDGE